MRDAREARPRYRSILQDSARWDGFAFRPGDIVISTPPKCGTTWMQMLCALLIFQTPVLDSPLAELSPWLDMLTMRRDDVVALLDAQRHRRFIKTHTPLDGLPADERVTYVCVGRDPRDVAVSSYHHLANMDGDTFMQARAQAVGMDDVDELRALDPPSGAETLEASFWHWIDNPTEPVHTTSSLRSALHHYEEALRAADRANVVVFHYGDLKADLEGEMRRLADRLGIAVAEQVWPELVEAASFERMRARPDDLVRTRRRGSGRSRSSFSTAARVGAGARSGMTPRSAATRPAWPRWPRRLSPTGRTTGGDDTTGHAGARSPADTTPATAVLGASPLQTAGAPQQRSAASLMTSGVAAGAFHATGVHHSEERQRRPVRGAFHAWPTRRCAPGASGGPTRAARNGRCSRPGLSGGNPGGPLRPARTARPP